MLRHSTYVEVRLPNIARNVELIKKYYAPDATLITMVKGDAYGNGLVPVAQYLREHCNIRYFGVASFGEAEELLRAKAVSRSITTTIADDDDDDDRPSPLNTRDTHIIVFSDTELLNDELREVYREQNALHAAGRGAQLIPVVGTIAALEVFLEHRVTTFQHTPLWLKVNTGMNRLGLTLVELFGKSGIEGMEEAATAECEQSDAYLSESSSKYPNGVVSLLKKAGGVDVLLQHFSVSGLVNHAFTRRHLTVFAKAIDGLRRAEVAVRGASAANSGAIEQRLWVSASNPIPDWSANNSSSSSSAGDELQLSPSTDGDLRIFVRPGLLLYGPSSLVPATIAPDMEPIFRPWDGTACGYFFTKVLRHYVVKAGSFVGYGVTRNMIQEDVVMVLLPVGYADGFLRYYSGMPITVSPVRSDGTCLSETPLVGHVHGNVNMDMIAVAVFPSKCGKDIAAIMEEVKDESQVSIWGNDIADKARSVKSIPYQLMCALSTRVPRRYVYE